VGLVIGSVLFLFRFALAAPGVPIPLAAILIVTLSMIMTRGFHLDGLADTMDALLSHRTPEEKLAIMKDPHQGTFGVVAIVLDILLKTFLVMTLLTYPVYVAALVLHPLWGRLSTTVVTSVSTYARPSGGLGRDMVECSGAGEFAIGLLTAAAVSALFGITALLCCVFAALLGFLLGLVWRLALGGVTGDLLGSTTEISEICSLMFFVMIV
ncbi:MAG: adenosylcobinamide-GDP ribazoletransferase, partial [Deltaproteobacteria bacterium]|jgi:adenosylcobinamide-GDP ribazoletransferase|nr:adenosylcobinamide-GDP ribazoletransferase [Deltaproteobacteria bacterium]